MNDMAVRSNRPISGAVRLAMRNRVAENEPNSARSPPLLVLQCRQSQIKGAKTGGIQRFSNLRPQHRAAHRNTLLRCQARRTFQNITKPSGMPVISFWNAVEFRAIPSG